MSAITTLYDDIRAIIINTRNTIYKAVNTGILEANWKIGRRIVEEEQAGASRAEYGQRVINDLAEKLSVEFGRGFDARELRRYRQFYLLFPKWDALRPELTWTHYRTLIRVENERARLYYMNEAALQNWSTRALDSQIERLTYERILSSQNQLIVKEAEDAASRQAQLTPADIIKDPYVLDFLGLPSGVNFYEKDLEKALIDNLQQFLFQNPPAERRKCKSRKRSGSDGRRPFRRVSCSEPDKRSLWKTPGNRSRYGSGSTCAMPSDACTLPSRSSPASVCCWPI